MRLSFPIHARTSYPEEYGSIEVGCVVTITVPDPPDPQRIEKVARYARELGLYLAKGSLPYARRLYEYAKNNLQEAAADLHHGAGRSDRP